MDAKRLYYTVRLCLIRTNKGRGEYLRKHGIFRSVGHNFKYMPRTVPLYANLIKLGDNVTVGSNAVFHTHDAVHSVTKNNKDRLPSQLRNVAFKEGLGCIEIGSDVYIADSVRIEHGVKIGDFVVVTTGSVVTNDIPSDSVVRGNPAKVVCSLTQYLTIKAAKKTYPDGFEHKMGSFVGKELENWLWEDFDKSRQK